LPRCLVRLSPLPLYGMFPSLSFLSRNPCFPRLPLPFLPTRIPFLPIPPRAVRLDLPLSHLLLRADTDVPPSFGYSLSCLEPATDSHAPSLPLLHQLISILPRIFNGIFLLFRVLLFKDVFLPPGHFFSPRVPPFFSSFLGLRSFSPLIDPTYLSPSFPKDGATRIYVFFFLLPFWPFSHFYPLCPPFGVFLIYLLLENIIPLWCSAYLLFSSNLSALPLHSGHSSLRDACCPLFPPTHSPFSPVSLIQFPAPYLCFFLLIPLFSPLSSPPFPSFVTSIRTSQWPGAVPFTSCVFQTLAFFLCL